MKVLDLFCGAGGAAMGLAKAGLEIMLGIDIQFQRDYPFTFKTYNALDLPPSFVSRFDLVWASPPCQAYSSATNKARKDGKCYPNLIGSTRQLLQAAKVKYVIENVPGAPLRHDLLLCGQGFGLQLVRHRIFEIEGFSVPQPPHWQHWGAVTKGGIFGIWNGGRPGGWRKTQSETRAYRLLYTIAGNQPGSQEDWARAMQTPWIRTKRMIAQAVPPAYSQYIGWFFLHPIQRLLVEYSQEL